MAIMQHNWRQLVQHRIHYMQTSGWDVDIQYDGAYPTKIITRAGKVICDEVRDWREAYMWLDGFLIGADTAPVRTRRLRS